MPNRSFFHALLGLGLFTLVTVAVAALPSVLRIVGAVQTYLPKVAQVQGGDLAVATEIFDRHGEKIGELNTERRYRVKLKDLPEHVRQAFLSAEDKNFYRHFGISPLAIVRSALANLRGRALLQGASTITQQVVRLYFLDQHKAWERKATEAILALALERQLAKDTILELYLNKIYLGNHSYGVEAAARNYFRKSAADLDIGEAALLAGLAQSPSRYAPNHHRAAASRRQLFVLKRMEADGYLQAGDAAAWSRRVAHVAPGPEDFSAKAPYFIDAVKQELARKFEFEQLPRDGLKIYTTLDAGLQRAAAKGLSEVLGLARRTQIKPGRRRAEIEGALLTLEPHTGAVLAMQGGSSFGLSQFNRTEAARRRLGGLFVPVYVALGLERGFTLVSRVGDDPLTGRRVPGNYGTPTLYEVLVKGLTFEAAPLYSALGSGSVRELATGLGFNFDREDVEVALGYGEATPTQVAVAYSAFVNGGSTPEPYLLERVDSQSGQRLYTAPGKAELSTRATQVLSRTTAYIMSQTLAAAVTHGHLAKLRGVSPASFGTAAASDDLHDAWFAGGLPNAVSAVWIGAEHGHARLGEGEAAAAAWPQLAWTTFMRAAPPEYLQLAQANVAPSGITFARCAVGDSAVLSLPFALGTEPNEVLGFKAAAKPTRRQSTKF